MSKEPRITDRYQALGIPYPNPKTMCKGPCEGTGWVPVIDPKLPRRLRAGCAKFVKCPDCRGTGKRRRK